MVENFELIKDIELNIKVRLGIKELLLQKVKKFDIGSIIELDKKYNEPVELIIDNKIIGEGEIVVIDGEYAVRVLKINNEICHKK